jgi:hypothetical protein
MTRCKKRKYYNLETDIPLSISTEVFANKTLNKTFARLVTPNFTDFNCFLLSMSGAKFMLIIRSFITFLCNICNITFSIISL